jgi:mediator of RNA polymerase II transcription subunit 23
MAISKDIVKNYVDSALKSEVLEDSFMPFTLKRDEHDSHKTNGTSCPGTKRVLLTMSTSSEPDKIIQHYVNLMAQVKSPAKFDGLFDVLRLLVQQHPNLGKAVCEALLSCDRLDYYNRNSWMRSFELIQEILPNVDYKGVRDILKYVLEIIYSLPEKFDITIIPQLDMLYNTFSMILDREACLLPAYLGLDELQKRITQGSAPVWKFAELFYHFIESFRQTAQIFSIINRPDLLPVVGYSFLQSNTSWRLDPISAKFQLKGLLPYRDKLKEPQVGQVRYLLEQSYSREMMCTTLSLSSKTSQQSRCAELIEQMAVSLVAIMDRSEANVESYGQQCASTSEHLYQWAHLSSNMMYYIVYNQATISFNQLVDSLCEKIRIRNHKRGSEHLMWALLQYITGFPKQTLSDFISVSKLFDILYSSRRPLPVLPEDSPQLPYSMAAASIWFQIAKRAEMDQVKILKPLPPSLQLHYEYLTNMKPPSEPLMSVGFKEVVYLNAYASNKSGFPVNNFIDPICKVEQNYDPKLAAPIAVNLLDTLTTHSKVSLLHTLVQRIITIAQNKNQPQSSYIVTPALIETYGRLLVYPDSESFGIKSFIGHLMGGPQAVWRYQAWDVYHVLLEMYSYRIHHLSVQFKYQMLVSMHSLSPMVYGANQIQLSMTLETAELKLLLGLSNQEALNIPINPRHTNDMKTAKQMINSDSEELNKVLVLVLARALHLTSSDHIASGVMIEDILADINKVTPLSWSSSTLSFFPTLIKDFFTRNTQTKTEDKGQLRLTVEEEYRKWQAMANDETRIAHFSQPSAPPLFICVVWRMLVDQDFINPIVFRILDTFRIRTLSTNIKTFVDYLVHEFSTSGAANINKNSDALNRLLCKYQIINLERLLLCMCLRSYDGCEAQVCYFIIQLVLLKSDFKAAVTKFCDSEPKPSHEHWRQDNNFQEVNAKLLKEFPEKYYHDFMAENNIRSNGVTLPSFFSNVCLRTLPVFDIIIHRALELRILSPNSAMKIDSILDNFGKLYRFHDKPLTYLYNTLYYYDSQLPSALKKKLTKSIVCAFNDIRPQNWCLTEPLLQYLVNNSQQAEEWAPGLEYYRKVIGRLVDTLQNKNAFYHTDWRFNEFPNVKAHAVHATAIEFMTLPVAPTVVGNAILDLVLTSYVNQERSTISQWMNAIGLVMTALPSSYYSVLNTKILEYMKSPLLTNPAYTRDILHLMNFSDSHDWMYESQISYLIALTHSIWHHSSIGMIHNLQTFWRMEVKHAVETESQFLFVCCLIGPFLSRLERSRLMMDVVVELYEMLGKVDSTSDIQHLNTISDFFYHIKYMFTGDAVKNDIERCIRNFKPRLQYCLRFITHLNISSEVLMKHD